MILVSRVVAEPTTEPITLEEAYVHLRIVAGSDGTDEDDLILGLIQAAREYCENHTGLSLALKDYEVGLTAWPDDNVIELPHPPFVSLLNGILISDEVSDNAIDEDSYSIDTHSVSFARISPATTWPVLGTSNRVRIRYRAGYGDESEAAGHLPKSFKAAMLLMLGHLYANREAVNVGNIVTTVPLGVEALLAQYRLRIGIA